MEQNISIKCPIHRRELIVTGCINPNCNRSPLICQMCPDSHSDHYSNIVQISEWLQKVAKTIQEGSKTLKQIRDINQIDSVLKWCEDNEMHLKKVDEHCKAQKALINEDFNYLKDLFVEKCNQAQAQLEQDIEDFYTKYKEQFKICKLIMDDSYILQKQCNPYSNVHNLILKLQQSNPKEAQELITQIRKLINKPYDPIENIKQCADSITEMTYNLPVFAFQDGIDSFVNQLADQIHNHFKTKLNITLPRKIVSPIKYQPKNLHKQYSLPTENMTNNYNSNQNTTKSPRLNQKLTFSPQNSIALHSKTIVGQCSDFTLKPLKKYQLDFCVSAIEVVTPQVIAMTCSNDPHLRVFDTIQKRIHTLSTHTTPIIQIHKSIDTVAPLQQHNNQKSQTYLFTLSNELLVVWAFDFTNTQMIVPHIYHKYLFNNQITQSCYLQDNSCIVVGDSVGTVEVYNFQQSKLQQNGIKGKHQKQISSILLLKKHDKFICSSYDQTLSIWKMLYNQQSFENTYCESIIQCGNMLGQIQIINQFQSNPNLLLVGNLEGSLKIVNLMNQCVILESDIQKNTNSICDFIIAEDANKETISVITYLQSSKSLRFWRLQNNDMGWAQNEQKIEVALSLSENMIRSKLQLVQMPSSSQNTVVLIANEINKELLVYEIINKQ
ncbi:unnamed protein product (macronuclear) [Paramecium tetraurelia]|uniref:Anaphase-promoting complex subunit 4 WD40 domain-containing protein n=1 Tax=Paramecium tetraurelia TaxID=5888 RepID=A0DJS0_PARTE|nr:uncharacterized protein GSPATT00017631001 [Paramecium tetraurelia]CAK83287.1 unnamed protein product [Paramecium tetraurelia]|eukprot:XP_001450684.1 hypothetical protein (macronuclear) [Paramecium tetraurelia strain d4-2]